MPETPPYIINLVFSAAMVVSLLYGIEAIARASELFFYVIIVILTFSMILVIPNIDLNNILPILEKGVIPPLKGTLPLLSFTALPTIILNMIYPSNITNIKTTRKSLFTGYLVGMSITFISVLMCNLVLGPTITASSRFPVYLLTKEINVGMIFTRLEALVVIVWLLTIFNNAVFFFYGGMLGLAQLLQLKNHKSIILPLGLIVTVASGFIYKDVPYEIKWDTEVWPPYILTIGLFLPLLLLLVYYLRKLIFQTQK
jgi:spore germination protein KB